MTRKEDYQKVSLDCLAITRKEDYQKVSFDCLDMR